MVLLTTLLTISMIASNPLPEWIFSVHAPRANRATWRDATV